MAKGPIVTTGVEALIASVYQKHPKWKAPEVRNEVSFVLRKRNPKLPSGWPSLSTVQKVLAIVRRKMKERPVDPRDESWSTASMVEYPIPAEALPSILQLWVWTRENFENSNPFSRLTIRQAQWAARFYAVTKDMETLSILSRGHALSEGVCELIGAPYVSNNFTDLMIFGVMTGQKITPERQKKILGLSDETWPALQEGKEFLHSKNEFELQHFFYSGFKKQMEAQNERVNKAKG